MEKLRLDRAGGPKAVRDSNIELYRILMMLLIIAHHYVVNSGLDTKGGPIYADPLSAPSLFLLLFGAWGKMGLNCFVLVTGYYMCTAQITARKFAKIFLEIVFYRMVIAAAFWITGYAAFTWQSCLRTVFIFDSLKTSFFNCYLYYFLLIPFLNILLRHISEKQLLRLLLLLFFMYVVLGTFKCFTITKNYVSWFAVLHLTAAYIRMYPKKLFENRRLWGIVTVGLLLVGCLTIVLCARDLEYAAFSYVRDSNTFLAYATAISSFLFFKNLKLPYSRFINTVASSAFGVLCIHASGSLMRFWLWNDALHVVDMYGTKQMYLHAILSVLGIYAVCTVIDMARIRWLERPFFVWWDKRWPAFARRFACWEERLCRRLHISG